MRIFRKCATLLLRGRNTRWSSSGQSVNGSNGGGNDGKLSGHQTGRSVGRAKTGNRRTTTHPISRRRADPGDGRSVKDVAHIALCLAPEGTRRRLEGRPSGKSFS